mmetsp:Transcript_56249/g.119743  ORF Transcript_56249/g.119743 Transcript_56249/m.119743 type:complete len:334 (-) Transcript_56249:2117-3118(-)
MELLALDKFGSNVVVSVADAFAALLPDRVRRPVSVQLPHTVGSTRANTTAAISDHGVQSEELSVVVVQVIALVGVLWVVLGGLGKCDAGVQTSIRLEEAGNTRNEEVRLELMPRIGDGIQRRSFVLIKVALFLGERILVLAPVVVDNGDVVVYEVQTTSLAVTGSKGNLALAVAVRVRLAVDHFDALSTKLKPLCGVVLVDFDLVVPSSRGHMLDHDVSGVLGGFCTGGKVHAERCLVRIWRHPVPHVVVMRGHGAELVVAGPSDLLMQDVDRILKLGQTGAKEILPIVHLLCLIQRRLSAQPCLDRWIQGFDVATNLAQPHRLCLIAPNAHE